MKLLHALLVTTILTTVDVVYAAGGHAGGHGSDAPAAASMSHDAMGHGGDKMEALASQNTVKMALEPVAPLEARKTAQVTVKLNAVSDGKPLTLDDLKEAHTQKLHLLIVDPTLTDYHHIHPVAGQNPGEYVFDFKPLKNDSYRVWADVIPIATGKQEYVQTNMGTPAKEKSSVEKAMSMTATVDGYTFTLALEGEPKAGNPVMGNVVVTKDGRPFTALEPVMGAFAHVVGFTEDYNSVLHVHPMGKEPTSDAERGGPKLEFHIEPEKVGFVKLFAQVRIGGKDIFAPFGITVK